MKPPYSLVSYLGFGVFLLLPCTAWSEVSCIDQDGNPVDWFVAYKIPQSKSALPWAGDGLAFYYMDVNNQEWRVSKTSLGDRDNAVSHTLQQVYSNYKSPAVAFAMYNDETPDGHRSEPKGHSKGVFCLDESSGFWLVHSVPGFPMKPPSSYEFPKRRAKYGQMFICVTYGYEAFNSIGEQLMYNRPLFYDAHIPDAFSSLPDLKAAVRGSYVKEKPYKRAIQLKSKEGQEFTVFSKTAKFDADIFHEWMAPYFSSEMYSETWQNGRNPLKSNCSGKYAVKNIKFVQFPDVQFKETTDHSKWAITTSQGKNWVCIGDINRMHGQKYRGGGFVCFNKTNVWDCFRDIIGKVEQCDETLRYHPLM